MTLREGQPLRSSAPQRHDVMIVDPIQNILVDRESGEPLMIDFGRGRHGGWKSWPIAMQRSPRHGYGMLLGWFGYIYIWVKL